MPFQNRLGVCTWLFGDLSLDEIAGRVARLGFDGVELMGDLAQYRAREVARILGDHGLEVLSLTPADVDLAHPDPVVRAGAVDYFLRLVDFAAELAAESGTGGLGGSRKAMAPLVGCHGLVGRVRAIAGQDDERACFVEAVQRIADHALPRGLRLVMEVLNRYEAHLLNTAEEAFRFVADVSRSNVGILLDAYHMNIEEANPAAALRLSGERLWLYHVADSNRKGVGRGHTDFGAQVASLREARYGGPVILECTAPGPDPFRAIKGPDSIGWLEAYLTESAAWLKDHW